MIRRVLALGASLALLPTVSQAAVVMLVDGVPGNAAIHQSYVGWFSLETMTWGIDRPSPAAPHALTVALESTATVATIMQASASGAPFKKIVIDEITFTGSGPPILFLRLTCDEAKVQLNIRCGKLGWESFDYMSQGALTKSVKGSWNFKTNTP